VQSEPLRPIPYEHQPSGLTSLLPKTVLAVFVFIAALVLMGLAFKDSPMLSAGFVMVLLTIVIGGAAAWVSDSRQRGRAHSEQLTTVHETVAQAVAPAVANAVMQLVGGIVAQSWPAGGAAPAQVINHRPPQAVAPQLPARVVPIMRYVDESRQAIPINAPVYQPVVIETITGDDDEEPGQTIQVPLNHLMRFASCPTPARAEWQGKPQLYGEAARVFLSHGLMTRTSRGGFAWRPEYPVESRRTWLAQYEAKALGAGAHAGETPPLG